MDRGIASRSKPWGGTNTETALCKNLLAPDPALTAWRVSGSATLSVWLQSLHVIWSLTDFFSFLLLGSSPPKRCSSKEIQKLTTCCPMNQILLLVLNLCQCSFILHKITEWLRLEETSGSHLVKPPAQAGPSRASCKDQSGWLLSIFKDGNSTTSLGNRCQWSATCTVKKVSWYSEGTSWVSVCAYSLSLVLSLGTTEKSLALSSFHPPFRYLHTLMRSSPCTFSSQG